MADEANEPQDELDKETTQTTDDNQDTTTKQKLSEDYADMIEKIVEDRLGKMKSNVDKAYKKAEELARENTRLKENQQAEKRKQLEAEGKHLEVANLKLTEYEETNKILNERLTSLTRDRELDSYLGGLEFKNEFAKETAFKAIVSELVQDDDERWVHKSGAPIGDYIKAFRKDPDKDFLFKPKDNSGTGTSTNNSSTSTGRPKTLEGVSTEDLLRLAEQGKLGSITY